MLAERAESFWSASIVIMVMIYYLFQTRYLNEVENAVETRIQIQLYFIKLNDQIEVILKNVQVHILLDV